MVLIFVLYFFFKYENADNVFETHGELYKFLPTLVQDRCTENGAIDRRLLQQTWYDSKEFLNFAMIFDSVSFSITDKPKLEGRIDGAFCINGNDLMVRYYRTNFIPNKVNMSKNNLNVKMATQLKLQGKETITVKEITSDKMILKFHSTGEERTLYRKN